MTNNRTPFTTRLWARVKKAGPKDCWAWLGSSVEGYGTISLGGYHGKKVRAHRAVWAEINGPIPEGKVIMHTCDTPSCCNPAHLVLGTHADNIADKIKKGRCYTGDHRGEKSWSAVLTDAKVRKIRKAKGSQTAIGKRFGVSQRAVSDILTGKTWSHVK